MTLPKAIVEYVKTHPGLTSTEISEQIDYAALTTKAKEYAQYPNGEPWVVGTTLYVLVKKGLLRREGKRGNRYVEGYRYYAN